MNKVIGHYKAVCPFCKGVLKYQIYDNSKKKMLSQCIHFYCFWVEHEVCFCTAQLVQAEENDESL